MYFNFYKCLNNKISLVYKNYGIIQSAIALFKIKLNLEKFDFLKYFFSKIESKVNRNIYIEAVEFSFYTSFDISTSFKTKLISLAKLCQHSILIRFKIEQRSV